MCSLYNDRTLLSQAMANVVGDLDCLMDQNQHGAERKGEQSDGIPSNADCTSNATETGTQEASKDEEDKTPETLSQRKMKG